MRATNRVEERATPHRRWSPTSKDLAFVRYGRGREKEEKKSMAVAEYRRREVRGEEETGVGNKVAYTVKLL